VTEALAALRQRLGTAGYELENATVGGHDALVARRSDFRWSWIGTRLHTFVVVFSTPALSESVAERLTSAARQYAIDHKHGLPRGLQTGTATVAVFLSEGVDPSVRSWFTRAPKARFAAISLSVLLDRGSNELTYFRGRRRTGWIYSSHLRAVAELVGHAAAAPSSSAAVSPAAPA
jgi:hypothetical protein